MGIGGGRGCEIAKIAGLPPRQAKIGLGGDPGIAKDWQLKPINPGDESCKPFGILVEWDGGRIAS